MRVLFAVSSWPGHYFPMIPLGWALRGAGHDVRVLCTPSDVDAVTGAGLTPVPVLDGLDALRGARLINVLSAYLGDWPYPVPPPHPDTAEPLDLSTFDFARWQEETGPELAELSRHSTDAAVRYARGWRPDLVVHDQQSLEGPLVAAVTGVPDVLHLWGPVGTHDAFGPVAEGQQPGQASMPKDPSEAFARHGAGEMSYDHIDHVLDPCPAAIRPAVHGNRVPIRYVPYNGPGSAPLDLPEAVGRPRVCVIWGRSATRTFGRAVNKLPQVVEAATALGAEVLLLASPEDARGSGPLPETVHPMLDVPLSLVLPGCDAVVHYGGGGVTMTAVTAGVPQVSLPCGFDQPLIAGRVTAAGAGLDIPNHAADAAAVEVALGKVLGDPSFALAARELAAESAAMPSPAEAVAVLERLAGGRECSGWF
jgi:UDP:flavonoid glycosyltransferase YjiC (YdhE family)